MGENGRPSERSKRTESRDESSDRPKFTSKSTPELDRTTGIPVAKGHGEQAEFPDGLGIDGTAERERTRAERSLGPATVRRTEREGRLDSEPSRLGEEARELASRIANSDDTLGSTDGGPAVVHRQPSSGSGPIDQNQLHHIFGQSKHDMDPLVNEFGSEEAAFNRIKSAIQSEVDSEGISEVFEEVTVEVGPFQVTVSGRVIDGEARIGTAYRE